MDPIGSCSPELTVRCNQQSSADKVGSNDDLLTVILLRLPVLSLVLFKSVSKHWLSLIKSPNFTQLRTKTPKFDPPSGLFLQSQTGLTFLPLDARLPVKNPQFDLNSGDFKVLQSCNGLLLCLVKPDKFYVYNPTLNLFKLLPLPYLYSSPLTMSLAFDPAVSPHYKVVYPRHKLDHRGIHVVHIQVYSSQTDKWSVSAKIFRYQRFFAFHKAIYWRGAFRWVNCLLEVYHFSLDDIDGLRFIQVDTPKTLYERLYFYDKLAVCFDCLLLLHKVRPLSSLQIVVYEMKNEFSGWYVKYHVNLDHIITEYNVNHVFLNQCCRVLSVLFGEREEDLFLVVEVPGKLIRCNIVSNTFHELCELVPTEPHVDEFCSFLFNASLASV